MTRRRDIDPRIYLLTSIFTIGLGLAFVVLYIKTPLTNEVERTLYLIGASALFPAGVLWTVEHYFLHMPLEGEFKSVLEKYRTEQRWMETIQSAEKHSVLFPMKENLSLGACLKSLWTMKLAAR